MFSIISNTLGFYFTEVGSDFSYIGVLWIALIIIFHPQCVQRYLLCVYVCVHTHAHMYIKHELFFTETAKTFQYQPNIFIWGLIFIYWIRQEHCHAYNYLISSQIRCQSAAVSGILMGWEMQISQSSCLFSLLLQLALKLML